MPIISKKQESEVMEMGNLEVRIEVAVDTKDEIKELVRLAADLQKEYSCHCTLSVYRDN